MVFIQITLTWVVALLEECHFNVKQIDLFVNHNLAVENKVSQLTTPKQCWIEPQTKLAYIHRWWGVKHGKLKKNTFGSTASSTIDALFQTRQYVPVRSGITTTNNLMKLNE